MKTKFLTLAAVLLITAGGFYSCTENDDIQLPSDEIAGAKQMR